MNRVVFLEPMLHFFPLPRRDYPTPAGDAGLVAVLSHQIAKTVQDGNHVLSPGAAETEAVGGRFEFIFHILLYQAAMGHGERRQTANRFGGVRLAPWFRNSLIRADPPIPPGLANYGPAEPEDPGWHPAPRRRRRNWGNHWDGCSSKKLLLQRADLTEIVESGILSD